MSCLQGKVVVITGANRGIGRATGALAAAQGARVVLWGRNRRALEKCAQEMGGAAFAVVADVTRPAEVRRAFQVIMKRTGRVDALINNAGAFVYKSFTKTTQADWDRSISSNLSSLFIVTQAALPLLRRGRDPHVVNMLSISSHVAFEKCSAYTAAKFGALGLTQVLRKELAPLGIRVSAVLPGSTHTRMADEFDFPVDRKKLLQPEDVANAVLSVLCQPQHAAVEELRLMSASGPV